MGRQWELQLLLPFSFYIDAKVLLFFELTKFNLGRVRQVRRVGRVGELFGYRLLILRSSFALLILFSSFF